MLLFITEFNPTRFLLAKFNILLDPVCLSHQNVSPVSPVGTVGTKPLSQRVYPRHCEILTCNILSEMTLKEQGGQT